MSDKDPIRYALRFGGMCRDCADSREHGVCDISSMPCETSLRRACFEHALKAWKYGIAKGFMENPFADESAAEIASLRSQLDEARRADEWQDIGTAPKDGTALLLAHSAAVFSGWWHDGVYGGSAGWTDGSTDFYEDYCLMHPTHWRPLPAPPALQSTDGKEVGG